MRGTPAEATAEVEVGVTSGVWMIPFWILARLKQVLVFLFLVIMAVSATWYGGDLTRIATLPRAYVPVQLAPFLLSTLKKGDMYFYGMDGLIVIEAEHYDLSYSRLGQDWRFDSLRSGYSGEGYVMPGPRPSVVHWDIETTSPELVYNVYFARSGIYQVRLRGYAEDELSNSVHIGLDGMAKASATHISTRNFDRWSWLSKTMAGTRAAIEVTSPGYHTVHVWMRESRFRLDRIVLSDDALPTPISRLYESNRLTY